MTKEEYPFYPELTEQGKKEAGILIKEFEEKLRVVAQQVISECTSKFYTNIIAYVESDTWSNFRNTIVNALSDYNNKSDATYDFSRIRKAIYEEHKEEIVKDLNQDLVEKVKALEQYIEDQYESFLKSR